MNIFQGIKSSKRARVLLVGVIIWLVGTVSTIALTYYADPNHPYTVQHQALEAEDGTLIQAMVYTPVDTSSSCPGIVVGHGFCENKEYMQALSIELVKRGFVIVSIDFRGHGSSDGYLSDFARNNGLVQDMLAGVDYLDSLGFIDRIGLAGHSMGGATSMLTASQNPTRINATVAIGALTTFSSGGNISDVHNLLAVFGLYEQGITIDEGLDFLRTYTGLENVEVGTIYGSFVSGTATKVVVSPYSEHLLEPINSDIIYQAVLWFEQAFNGATSPDIQLTSQFLIVSLAVSLVGLLMVLFIFMVYLGNYIFKRKQIHPRVSSDSEKFPVKPILGYLLAAVIGFILLIPLSSYFEDIAPITMFNSVFAGQVVGLATGVFVAILLFSFESRRLQLGKISDRVKEMVVNAPFLSILYGIIAGIVTTLALIAMYDWSFVTSLPTTRETGVIFALTFLLFPFFFLREFYLRGYIQERLKYPNRVREYFTMVIITIVCDVLIFIPVMMVGWQTATLGFVALALTAVTLFIIFQHVLVTWAYMHSGRNILGSTIFYCILFAFMVICFYPFGQPMPLIR